MLLPEGTAMNLERQQRLTIDVFQVCQRPASWCRLAETLNMTSLVTIFPSIGGD
jgi:hypothetical protein